MREAAAWGPKQGNRAMARSGSGSKGAPNIDEAWAPWCRGAVLEPALGELVMANGYWVNLAYLSTLLFGCGKMYSPADLCFLKVSKIGHEYVYEGYSWDI